MAYTADVKSELMQSPVLKDCCAGAELTALLLLSGSISLCGLGRYRLTFGSENAAVVRYCFTQLKRAFALAPEIRAVRSNQRGEHIRYQLQLEGEEAAGLLDRLGLLDPKQLLGIRMRPGRAILSRECCRKAYLRGAFLACGWISQPEKAYHFEFAAPDEEQAKTLQELIARWDVQARISARKSQQIVYVKKSEDVETLLGVLGASSALLTFENVRIMKSLRNDLNRQMICDDFNTDKTVRAAAQQLDDIAVIEKYLGLGKLPASLRQAAEARIASPDATLSQLGELMDPPAAKSAVNKRIRRLGELAQKLRDEHGL
ncbi:MAG: DNA-binding protein WhiA [Eubacteriales bacterium]|nr:DNA-binding protein WhiA [Eubacteriales bacterium]